MDYINQMEPTYGEPEKQAVKEYMESGGWLTEFTNTRDFEACLAEYTDAEHASAVNNGTISLVIALMALGVGEGDEVIVPDFTQVASAFAVDLVNADAKLVDIDRETLCLDLEKAEAAITDDTAAIMYVSLNGRSHDMREVRALADEHDCYLIEDAAQSLGSTNQGRQLGTWGHVGSFSFSYAKIITTGQGGLLVTDDDDIAAEIEKIRDFGRPEAGVDRHVRLGLNSKFTDVQAVIGLEQAKRLDDRVERKQEMFELYESELADVNGLEMLPTDTDETPPWFIDILVRDADRDELMSYLDDHGNGTRPFYPSIHTQEPYHGSEDEFTNSLRASQDGLWLPSSFELDNEQISYICDHIRSFMTDD
jgi:perosamine synthetase